MSSSAIRSPGAVLTQVRAGTLTVVNLSPIDVGYGLLMVAALGLDHAGQGLAAAFMAVLLGNLVPACFSRTGQLLSGARPAQTLLVAELLRQVAGVHPEGGFLALIAAMVVCTAMAGALQLIFGLLRLGSVIKYLPIPVLSGYINAVALLIFWPALLLMLGFAKSATLSQVAAGLSATTAIAALFGAVLLALMATAQRRLGARLHWSIVGLFGGMGLFYLLRGVAGIDLGGRLPAPDSLLPPWHELQALLIPANWRGMGDLPALVLPFALAIAVLNAIEALVASARDEELAERRNDPNRVLIAFGVANVIGGLCGALPIAPSVSRVAIAWELGGRRRTVAFAGAFAVAVIVLVGGPALQWVPLPVVGALMAYLGWTMIDAWTRGQLRLFLRRRQLEGRLRRQVRTNLTVMLLVVAVALSGHLIASMFVGALAAMFLFVRDYSRLVIGRDFSGRHRRSLLMRQEHEADYLDRHGDAIRVVELNTPIVFGTADRVLDHLDSLGDDLRYLVLDCAQVSEIDDKGARTLVGLARRLARAGVEMHLAFVLPYGPRGASLRAAGLDRVLPLDCWHDDTDRALEAVETRVLAAAQFPPATSMDLRVLDVAAGMSESEIAVLVAHLSSECFPAGGRVFAQGDPGDRLYVLTMGEVEIQLNLDAHGRRRRVAAFAPGVVFGEMAMFGHGHRSADAIATVESAVWVLTEAQLARLESFHPLVAGKFMRNVARQLASRLAVTNDELVYATRA